MNEARRGSAKSVRSIVVAYRQAMATGTPSSSMMIYQNWQVAFMLFSTARIRRGSIKIECPDLRRTDSHAGEVDVFERCEHSVVQHHRRLTSDGAAFFSPGITT